MTSRRPPTCQSGLGRAGGAGEVGARRGSWPKAQPKCCTVFFFYRFLFQLLPQAFIPLSQPPLLTPFYYSPVLLQQSNCSLASILFSVQKAPEKTHTHTHTEVEQRRGWGSGSGLGGRCINNACNLANCLEMAKCFSKRASYPMQNARKCRRQLLD